MFTHLNCPGCKKEISAPDCPMLVPVIDKEMELTAKVKDKALSRAKDEKLDKDERLHKVYNGNMEEFALKILKYFMCFECKQPYFGGLGNCGADAQNEENQPREFKAEDLLCGSC